MYSLSEAEDGRGVNSRNEELGHSGEYYHNCFLARRDECPESYCRTPGVGVGVGVGVRVYKNFNLAHNS